MQEQTSWGRNALGAGHPVTSHLAHHLESLGAGGNGESNTWNDKLRHLIVYNILNSNCVNEAVFLKVSIFGIVGIITSLKCKTTLCDII